METPVPYRVKQEGRPPKNPEDKRSALLKCYVTPEESEALKLKCRLAGMSMSDFLRSLALDQEIKAQANPTELKQIRAELGRIGGNINQIAKKVNSSGKFEVQRFREMSEYLLEVLEKL